MRALGRCYWTEAWTARGHAAIKGASRCARERGGDRVTDWGSWISNGAASFEDEGGVCQTALVTTEWWFSWMLFKKKKKNQTVMLLLTAH